MDVKKHKEAVDEIADEMKMFIEDEDCGFTKKDIKACQKLLYDYIDALDKISAAPSDTLIMEQVKIVVEALNRLNEKTDYALVETEEREMIWEVIQGGAVDCGLQEVTDDITEEWRDW